MVYTRKIGKRMAIALSTGEKIALHRRRLEMSQFRLGQLVHESQQTVSHVETGEVKVDVERLKRYAIALQVDIGELL